MNPVERILGKDTYSKCRKDELDNEILCECGKLATHIHDGHKCCGENTCCPYANE